MKIFIVGGAGYIGSHMVKVAHQAGHDVVTVDSLSTGSLVLYGSVVVGAQMSRRLFFV